MTHRNGLHPWAIIEIEQRGAYQIAIAPGRSSGFISWGKKGTITGTNPFDEPGEPVWMGYGNTREQAKAVVLRDLEQQLLNERSASVLPQSRALLRWAVGLLAVVLVGIVWVLMT